MKAFVVLSFVLCCGVSLAQDPFDDQVKSEKQAEEAKRTAKKVAAEKTKEANSFSVPADLLAKMKDRDWSGRPVNGDRNRVHVTGKIVKVYYHRVGTSLHCDSFVVRNNAGEKEMEWGFSDPDNMRYAHLLVEKCYHGDLELPWVRSKPIKPPKPTEPGKGRQNPGWQDPRWQDL